jgi:hypothetical protein
MIESRALHALKTTYLQPQNRIYLSEVERLNRVHVSNNINTCLNM